MKAVYYARVSTEEEKQVNALSKQIAENESTILSMGWELVDSYVDEGVSGTTNNKRDEYNRLFADLETDKYDVICIKSQDRLMRNVKDWYIFIDRMVKNQKKLYLYLENKWYQSDDALITGIKAILAEEYSRDLSRKINNAHKRRELSGATIVTNGRIWGYDQNNGQLTINEEESKIVRMIFELYISGVGSRGISKILTEKGILTHGGTPFAQTTIRRMIKQEKYKGTLICNKLHKDFETKKIVKNPPSEWVIHENRIPAIIDKDTWQLANDLLVQKRKEAGTDSRIDKAYGYNAPRHPLGGKIVCGLCGQPYYRRNEHIKGTDKTKYVWQCSTYVRKGRMTNVRPKYKINPKKWGDGCDGINIEETQIYKALDELGNNNKIDINYVVDKMLEYLKQTFESQNVQAEIDSVKQQIAKLKKQKSTLLDRLLDEIISKNDFKTKNDEIETKINDNENKLQQLYSSTDAQTEISNRLNTIKEQLENGLVAEEKINFIINQVDKITVYQDHLNITLNILGGDGYNYYLNADNQGKNRTHLDNYIYKTTILTPHHSELSVYVYLK